MTRGPRSPVPARKSSRSRGPAARSTPAVRETERVEHPEFERLVDLADGRLGRAAERRLNAHLEICPACSQLERGVRNLLVTLETEGREAPPAALTRWARALPDRLPMPRRTVTGVAAAGRRLAEGLRAVRSGVMRLVADSWSRAADILGGPLLPPDVAGSPVGALRAGVAPGGTMAAPAGRRRILLAAKPFDLDLQIDYRGAEDPRQIRGQILPLTGSRLAWLGSEVRLLAGRRTVARVRVDRRGEFALPRVRAGAYRLAVSAGSAPGAARSTSPVLEV